MHFLPSASRIPLFEFAQLTSVRKTSFICSVDYVWILWQWEHARAGTAEQTWCWFLSAATNDDLLWLSINSAQFTILPTPSHYELVPAAPLVTQSTGRPDCHLTSACLCCLLRLPSLLTWCSLCCIAADMLRKQAEGSLSPSLSLPAALFWCHLLTYSRVLTSEVLGGEALPCDSLSHCVSLLSATEKTSPLLMWRHVTRPSNAEKSATCEQLQGT